MLTATKYVMIEIDGFEVEVKVPFEYTAVAGYSQTWDEPGIDDAIEDMNFKDADVIHNVLVEVTALVANEQVGVAYSMGAVLDLIQETMDEDDELQYELLAETKQEYDEGYGDYLYEQMKDRKMMGEEWN